jgi:3-hydroxymyristoyl/3-hydroxydecanoyl-(acyl carrier protein) dehydratase
VPTDVAPVLDLDAITALVPHRDPFLFIDAITAFEKGVRIVAVKTIRGDEPFFAGHFPGLPIMPGVLLVEAMAQAGVVLYTLSMDETDDERRQTKFLGQVEARFIAPAFPGDHLEIDLRVVRLMKGAIAVKGSVHAGDRAIVKAEFLLMQPRRTREGASDVRAER